MKQNKKHFPIMAIVAIVTCVLVIASCDGCGGESLPDNFEGNWNAGGAVGQLPMSINGASGSWTGYVSGTINHSRDTYTVVGNTVTIIITHLWQGGSWVISPMQLSGTISGNTMSINFTGNTPPIVTYTRS